MKTIQNILLLLTLSGLTACASMSPQECLNANWKTIGYEDGSMGRPEMTIQAHRKACVKINVTPDLAQYQQGHREGARSYCKKPTAYQLGVKGGAYYNVCPADLEPGFLQAYRLGQELFAITQQLTRAKSIISDYESRVDALLQQKEDKQTAIVNANTSPKERRIYLSEIDQLNNEIRRYEDDIANVINEIGFLEQDYASVQTEHHKMGY